DQAIVSGSRHPPQRKRRWLHRLHDTASSTGAQRVSSCRAASACWDRPERRGAMTTRSVLGLAAAAVAIAVLGAGSMMRLDAQQPGAGAVAIDAGDIGGGGTGAGGPGAGGRGVRAAP